MRCRDNMNGEITFIFVWRSERAGWVIVVEGSEVIVGTYNLWDGIGLALSQRIDEIEREVED